MEYAKKMGFKYFDVSAATGQNVDAMFEDLFKQVRSFTVLFFPIINKTLKYLHPRIGANQTDGE